MALIKCLECGREVSDKANACPQCGAPIVSKAVPAPSPVVTAPALTKAKPRVRVTTLVLLAGLAFAGYLVYRVQSGSSIRSAVAGPEMVFSETVSLDEGQARGYAFSLPTHRRVEVAVTATPSSVNVYLMNEQDWLQYNKIRQKLTGGNFTYRRALSRQSVLNMKQTDMLPPGSWRVVVERPSESLFGGKSTAATVKVTAL